MLAFSFYMKGEGGGHNEIGRTIIKNCVLPWVSRKKAIKRGGGWYLKTQDILL